MTKQLVISSSLPAVEQFQRQLEQTLQSAGFSEDLVHDLSLVCEEVLVNIIHYGYPSEEDPQREIRVDLCLEVPGTVRLEIRDDAIAFNPLTAPDRDPEDERLGGWGIPMLKSLTDHVEYAREGDHNVLRIERSERDS
jgi:serine/threonine-protein kinase RsbW